MTEAEGSLNVIIIYRIYSNKRRGAYKIFMPQMQRLFDGGVYLKVKLDKALF